MPIKYVIHNPDEGLWLETADGTWTDDPDDALVFDVACLAAEVARSLAICPCWVVPQE